MEEKTVDLTQRTPAVGARRADRWQESSQPRH